MIDLEQILIKKGIDNGTRKIVKRIFESYSEEDKRKYIELIN